MEKNNLNLEQLKRMSTENMHDDHIHEVPNGTFTAGSVNGSDNTHYHEYGDGLRTSMEVDTESHTHMTDLGETSEPK